MKKTIKVNINRNKCLGCGMCISLCPEVFEFKSGKSSLKVKASLEKYQSCIKESAQNCPVQAIKII